MRHRILNSQQPVKADTVKSLKIHIKQGKGNKILLSQEMSPILHTEADQGGPVLKEY